MMAVMKVCRSVVKKVVMMVSLMAAMLVRPLVEKKELTMAGRWVENSVEMLVVLLAEMMVV